MLFLILLMAGCLPLLGQTMSHVTEPRSTGMGGAMVAVAAEPAGVLHNPASLFSMNGMGSDITYATLTGEATDRVLVSYANPASEEGARFGTGFYSEGQIRPGPWKYYVPYIASLWSPLPRIAIGANLRIIHEIPRADSLKDKWSNSIDMGLMTAGKNLNFGARVEHAFGGTSVVPKTIQCGAALRSDNGRFTLGYQWDGELLNGIKYAYSASRIGSELAIANYGMIRAGYVWSEIHRITVGGAIGLTQGGSLMQFGWSFPAEAKAPTEWSVGLSYRI